MFLFRKRRQNVKPALAPFNIDKYNDVELVKNTLRPLEDSRPDWVRTEGMVFAGLVANYLIRQGVRETSQGSAVEKSVAGPLTFTSLAYGFVLVQRFPAEARRLFGDVPESAIGTRETAIYELETRPLAGGPLSFLLKGLVRLGDMQQDIDMLVAYRSFVLAFLDGVGVGLFVPTDRLAAIEHRLRTAFRDFRLDYDSSVSAELVARFLSEYQGLEQG